MPCLPKRHHGAINVDRPLLCARRGTPRWGQTDQQAMFFAPEGEEEWDSRKDRMAISSSKAGSRLG